MRRSRTEIPSVFRHLPMMLGAFEQIRPLVGRWAEGRVICLGHPRMIQIAGNRPIIPITLSAGIAALGRGA